MMFVEYKKILSRIKEYSKTTTELMVKKNFSVQNALPFGLKALKLYINSVDRDEGAESDEGTGCHRSHDGQSRSTYLSRT